MLSSFRSRILWLLLAVTLVVQAATVTALVVQTNRRAQAQAGNDLGSAGKVIDALLGGRAERLQQAVTVLAADYGIREAVTLSDRATIVSALENSARRVDAHIAFLRDRNGELIPATSQPLASDQLDELRRFIDLATDDAVKGYRTLGDSPYLLVGVPVKAPDTVATIVVGFAIDVELARGLSTMVGHPVSFLASDGTREHLVDTQSSAVHRDLILAIAERGDTLNEPTVLSLDSNSYVTRRFPISGAQGHLDLVLQKPLQDAIQPYIHARPVILGVALLALLLTVPIARVLANATSKPLEQLVSAARRIENGNYAEPIALDAPNEFHAVAATLNSMQHNIAEREERILRQAITDDLTLLPNRAWVTDYLLERERRLATHNAPIGLVLLQLKDFDRIRASLGHDLSDTVVREVARRLLGLRGTDDHVARVALSQFLYIAPNLGAEASQALARTLLQSIRAGLICDGVPISLDAHAGICVSPTHATHDLLRCADTALYDATQRGDAIGVYESGRDEQHRRQLKILGDLRRACDSNELELYYQPKVDMRSHSVHGLEALLRWTHPRHGRIPPSEFVPLAEKTGNIALLTNWVLKTALRQVQDWQKQGFHTDVSINLSATDLLNRELVELILEHVQLPDSQSQRLIFEITESAIMHDTAQVIGVMERLRQHRVRFSIDDFGTGYSSLAQFKHLPVDEIKIDQSFVRELAPQGEDAAIVRSIIDLGHNFGVKVVAEGVERPESWRVLHDLGCDLAQGYLIGVPVAVDQVISTVTQFNERLRSADTATQQIRAFRVV